MKAQSNSIVYSSFFDILECGLLNKSNYSLACNIMALSLYNKLISIFLVLQNGPQDKKYDRSDLNTKSKRDHNLTYVNSDCWLLLGFGWLWLGQCWCQLIDYIFCGHFLRFIFLLNYKGQILSKSFYSTRRESLIYRIYR